MSTFFVHGLPKAPQPLAQDAHKGEAGRVFAFAGSREMPGAATLCAVAALRGGAGLVTLACFDETMLTAAPLARPELVLWDLSGAAANVTLKQGMGARRFDVVVAGPGLGLDARALEIFSALLEAWEGLLVLDADTLGLLASHVGLRDRVREHPSPVVITPHPGEAARLLGAQVGRSEGERVASARDLAHMLGAVTILKGAGSLVVGSNGQRGWVNPSGNPGMATAGSGDVLAGLVAALLVGVHSDEGAWEAARQAVYQHGLAGDIGARKFGERALLASDILARLGPALIEGPWG